MGDAQIPHPFFGEGRLAAGNHGDIDARRHELFHAQAVEDVEGFELVAIGAEIESAITHDAVDVKRNQADPGGFGQEFLRPVRG